MTALTRRRLMVGGIGAALLVPFGLLAAESGLREHRRSGVAFGTTILLLVLHEDAALAGRALDAAFAEIRAVERAMSLFDTGSELSRLNRDGKIASPSGQLIELLTLSAQMGRLTGGAFDVTVQPYWLAWAGAAKRNRSPGEAELAAAHERVGADGIVLGTGEVSFARPGMGVTLNGIAQGYATDRVIKVLSGLGIAHALLDTGEFGVIGDREGHPWSVAIEHPRRPGHYLGEVSPLTGFLATAGDYATTFSADFADNHIFDPATGRSPRQLASATVIAPTGAHADALSTAVMVLGLDKGLALLRGLAGAQGVLVTKDGQIATTPGAPFRAFA